MDRKLCRNGLASSARCIVKENRNYTSIVHLFVIHISRSGTLTNKTNKKILAKECKSGKPTVLALSTVCGCLECAIYTGK